jgi:hypothetical protein
MPSGCHGHPDHAQTTYAFVPVTDGWLQLPLGLGHTEAAPENKTAAPVKDPESVGFEASVEYVFDEESIADAPRGRRVTISAADYVRVAAVFKGKVDPDSVSVELSGAAGTVDGILWTAAGSPSPENILPGFDAGPAALIGPELAFTRPTAATGTLFPLTSDAFASGQPFKLTLPPGPSPAKSDELPAYVWRGYFDMAIVTAIGMTRTAESSGLPAAHVIAALGALLAIPVTWRWKLQTGAGLDLTPSMHWPAPIVASEIEHDRGPVLVTIEYRIDPKDREPFLAALKKLARERRRDGAYAWGVFEDSADLSRMAETFLVESWLEHLRQHERVTNADRVLQDTVHRFQIEGAPKITHLIAAEPGLAVAEAKST